MRHRSHDQHPAGGLYWGGGESASRGCLPYGLFRPMDSDLDSDSDSDSKPDGYVVLCRTISTGSDSDLDPCRESFPNGYCTHFRDGSPSQGQISIPIPYI